MKRSKTPKLARGIRQRADGSYQVHKMIRGVRVWEAFPADTPESTMIAWREAQAKKPLPVDFSATAGSFAADIVEYGQRRAAMQSIRKVLAELHRLAAALGRDRPRNSIAADEIETYLQNAIVAGLSAASARRIAWHVQGFYRTMNGAAGPNPARLATKPPAPKYDEPRAIPYAVIAQILDHLAPMRPARGGLVPSLAVYRIRVIAYTGIPPGVLSKLRRKDIDLDGAIVHLPPRLKGYGVEARAIPLTVPGVTACRAFVQAGAFGPFKAAALNKAFKSAAKAVGLVDDAGRATVHCYDLRHSFGTLMYQLTRDLSTVGRFLGHAKGSRATQRYALGGNRDVDIAAARLASERLAAIAAEQKRGALHAV